MLALAALPGCREETWDPEVAALVNGRPIPKAAVEQVLEWGFYPALDRGGERDITAPRVLARLIDESLVLAEAKKAGLAVSDQEVAQAQDELVSAWFGAAPPPAELEDLRQALRRQLLLRKMTEKVAAERRVLSAAAWRQFWAGWPKNLPPRYLVRVLFLPPRDQAPAWPIKKPPSLAQLAAQFEKKGLAVILSGPLWLGADQFPPADRAALKQAVAEKRLAGPFRLPESWAVYEVLEVVPGPTPAEEFQAAKAAFEDQAGRLAFQEWLAALRAGADLKMAPFFTGKVL
ncbi:MAG: SurA N-terminal domain-containing protein [Candidatus Adiutrix sp.]|nr:SurA N-terminal domain-containing protein [Candidatus Adiutrix sp.]